MPSVLIVDDDPTMVEVLRSLLIDEGYTARTARDGVEALDRLLRAPVALVIADVRMPLVDGRTLVEELRRRGDHTPIILMSAAEPGELAAPGVRFVQKPFDLEQMLEVVAQIVDEQRQAVRMPIHNAQ